MALTDRFSPFGLVLFGALLLGLLFFGYLMTSRGVNPNGEEPTGALEGAHSGETGGGASGAGLPPPE